MRSAKAILSVGAILLLAENGHPQKQTPAANVIHVEVTGLHTDKGQVLCSLYSSRDGFPEQSQKALARAIRTIAPRQAVCDFSAIAPGSYAVSAFHDENSNGKVDTNFMGFAKVRRGRFSFFRRSDGTEDHDQLLIRRPHGQRVHF